MVESGKAWVEGLFARHRGALQAFFLRRLRTKANAADLAQEVYLRMLRVRDPGAILNPEAYLFAVAGNLVKENAIADRRQAEHADVEGNEAQQLLADLPDFDAPIDTARRVERLREVLAQLPPKCRAAVTLQYYYGLSYQEIAERLGLSTHMVKKYLAQALGHCRRRMARLG
jgi:RNA polymerase sigma-70 factor (ECF subfamily)